MSEKLLDLIGKTQKFLRYLAFDYQPGSSRRDDMDMRSMAEALDSELETYVTHGDNSPAFDDNDDN